MLNHATFTRSLCQTVGLLHVIARAARKIIVTNDDPLCFTDINGIGKLSNTKTNLL